MKKYIALLLILCTVFLCCACSKEKEDPAKDPGSAMKLPLPTIPMRVAPILWICSLIEL